MRGRAQKAGQTSSPTVQPATSSPATVVEPPTERAPAEGEAPAPAGAAGCAMDGAGDGVDERRAAEGGAFPSSEPVDFSLGKNVPGVNPPPPNKPEAGGGEAAWAAIPI